MKKNIKYTNEPIGEVEIIKDFLPPPEQLTLSEQHVKITINLKKSSVDFFKRLAKTNKSQYQKIIRHLLDYYASNYSN